MGDFFKMAIKDEETGIAFYTTLAENTKNNELKRELLHIADQERMHAERFGNMLKESGDKTPREEYSGQFEKFMNALLATRAFSAPEDAVQMAKEINSDKHGIDIATRMEKDTLLFYLEMLSVIPETHINQVTQIIEEEKVHLDQLAQLTRLVQ